MLIGMSCGNTAGHPAPALAVALVLALFAAGCTDDGDKPDTAPPSSTATGKHTELRQRPAPYAIKLASVAGDLRPRDRKRVTHAMARPVRGWANRSFLAGPWPRRRAGGASGFTAFSPDLRRSARRDAALLTLDRLGRQLTEVIPERRSIRLAAYVPRGAAVGGTAKVDLRILGVRREGEIIRVNVRADLSLTRTSTGKWRVFGYDVDHWVDRRVSSVATGGGS